MLYDLRVCFKELEDTDAPDWSTLSGYMEALMSKYQNRMPKGYTTEDMLEVIEALGIIRYDPDRGVFLVLVG
jgi:hypothetical protein